MSLYLIGEYIAVTVDQEEDKTDFGLIIVRDKGHGSERTGTVAKVGSGVIEKDGSIRPFTVKVGDKVVFNNGVGETIKVDGECYLIIKEQNIFAIVGE